MEKTKLKKMAPGMVHMEMFCWTRIACIVGLHVRQTCTQESRLFMSSKHPHFPPFVKPYNVLNLSSQNIFYYNCTWNPLLHTIRGRPNVLVILDRCRYLPLLMKLSLAYSIGERMFNKTVTTELCLEIIEVIGKKEKVRRS